MKKFSIVAGALLMSAALRADTVTSLGAFVSVPQAFQSTTGSNGGQGMPYWNNNSSDGLNMNVGDFLTGSNAGAGMATDYLGSTGGFGNYLSTGASVSDAPANFSLLQSASSVNITLLYTNAMANMSAYGTQIGLYNAENPSEKQVLFAHGSLYNPAPGSGGVYNNNISAQTPISVNTWLNYGVYANTCGYNSNGSIYCDTYYSNTALDQSTETARQHFALFVDPRNPQTYLIGFEDSRGLNATEGYGDFNDAIFSISTSTAPFTPHTPTTTPEPATFSILGIGLVGLGLFRRSRKLL
jgi:hypothetical protein